MKTRPKPPRIVLCWHCGQPVRRRVLDETRLAVHVDRSTNQQCIASGAKVKP